MSETEWKRWAQESPVPRGRIETKGEKNRRGKRRYDLRERAKRAIEDLVCVMSQLPKLSEHPERDYAMIFSDGKRLWVMIAVCSKAYEKKIAADLALAKTYTSEHRDALQTALGRAGLGYWSKSRLSDKEVRIEAVRQLMKKQGEDGIQYYMEVMRDRLANEHVPTEIIVERSAMLLAMSYQMRALEKKEQMERTSEAAEEPRKEA
jgi:hypothetical protein